MKRFRLATKLALAIVPIGLIALGAGYLVTQGFLDQAASEERVAAASRVAVDAMDVLLNVTTEQSAVLHEALGDGGPSVDASRSRVDSALGRLTGSVNRLVPLSSGPASGIASKIVSDSRRVANLIEDTRASDPLSEESREIFDEIGTNLISVVNQSTLFFGNEARAREGAGATALARASLGSSQQEILIALFGGALTELTDEEFAQQMLVMESTVEDWIVNADESSPTVSALNLDGTQVLDPEELTDVENFPLGRDDLLGETSAKIFDRVAVSADTAATRARTEALTAAGVVLGVILIAMIFAVLVGRSMVRRVRSVTDAARDIAEVELPKMVEALSDPRGQLQARSVELDLEGPDEVGDLARSFGVLHTTLVDVANQQMDTLRRGVSEIFVTLARRNRSLVDRQLALVDELESSEENPEVLEGYYRIDHLATRMRRNAESLLVLAGSEAPRMWAEPLEMGDVVRAALGEVDDYQRVDVLAVEPARVAGKAVTDVAHLLSELLDNATNYSPPSERVRVAGMFDDDGYILTVADNGIGLSEDKLDRLNKLIEEPPVLGLALDPTLGMYVVARLAKRHGIQVRLVAGVPGITVRITIPRELLETGDSGSETPPILSELPGDVFEPALVEPEAPTVATGPRSAAIPFDSPRARHSAPDDPRELVAQPGSEEAESETAPPTSPENLPDQPESSEAPDPTPVSPADVRPVSLPTRPAPGALPTRTPGTSFRDDEAIARSSSTSGRGAVGIRDALVGFRTGRDTALGSTDTEPEGDSPTGASDDRGES